MMREDAALAVSFLGAIAIVLLQAAIRSLTGDQAANCALIIGLWAVFYKSLTRMRPVPRGGKRARRRRPRRRRQG